ncbi:MAG: hypothetical protein JW860_08730 [Sedimentisphaerales bacterium]|nr:hypothetical protein [Sedimentisphaerales bacterium]
MYLLIPSESRHYLPALLLMLVLISFLHADTYYVNPGESIQNTIITASSGDTIQVAPGTYQENISLKSGVSLIGAGADVTVIDGGRNNHVISAINCDSSTVLFGFTITNGLDVKGGGIYIKNSTMTILNCVFSYNEAREDGGGIYQEDQSATTIINCLFSTNLATATDDSNGAGMYNLNSSPQITDCTFSGNTAKRMGGGMFNDDNSFPTITNCSFLGNSCETSGGGMHNLFGEPMLYNCRFNYNSSQRGGALSNMRSNPELVNCTFTLNSATHSGGGLFNDTLSNPYITNCILSNNSADTDNEISNDMSTPIIQNSLVAGCGGSGPGWIASFGTDADNNIDTDPCFVAPLAEDFHLSADSPCIDQGDDTALPAEVTTDLDGNPRFIDGNNDLIPTVDMGAYEFKQVSVISGRHIFYNNSDFDDPVDSLDDNDAVAPDKTALLPGQTASFANYTSYSRGINGIMIDIENLTDVPDSDDFIFRIGNSDDPETWSPAPEPSSITVHPGEGIDTSDRIKIIWPDNTIEGCWLQIAVPANAHTGLGEDDIFYFGNAIGDTGDSLINANVNAFDTGGVRNNPRNFLNPAPIDNHYDFNRDRDVNALDFGIARNHATNFLTALILITALEN